MRTTAGSAVAFVFVLGAVATAAAGGGRPVAASCSYFTARTVQIDTTLSDTIHISIRQNVQGTVKVLEQPRRVGHSSPGDGRLTVAVNWTSDSAELLDHVRTEVNTVDAQIGKIVTIQLDADEPAENTASVTVVASSTAAGVVALVILIAIAVAVVRRSSSSLANYKKGQREGADANATAAGADDQELEYYGAPAIYPNSIFSTGEVDNYFVSGDNRSTTSSRILRTRGTNEPDSGEPSTLNLSILYSEPATADERRSYRRPPSNMSTDWASSMSVQSSRRSSTKGSHYEVIRAPRQQPQQQQPMQGTSRQLAQPSSGGRWEGSRPWHIGVSGSAAAQPQMAPSSRRSSGSTAARRAQYARRPPAGSYSLTASSVADEDEDDDDVDEFTPVIEVPSEFASPDAGGDTSKAKTVARTGSSSPLLSKSVALLGVVAMLTSTAYSLCTGKPAANVVIVLPAGVRVGSVKLFANRLLQPSFIETDWYLTNQAAVHVYDADDLPVSVNKPCTTKMTCPSAANKSLVECEVGTQTCVCERGYRMTNRLVCEDVDECLRDVCPPGTFCRNNIGSFNCLCPPGRYRRDADCAVCSSACPNGFFESKPCNFTADRVCQACQKCPQGSYAYKPCSGRQDTECIRDGVQLEASANVFAEQLPVETAESSSASGTSSAASLEQPLYVTDNSQKMSFVWERPSGIRVYVDVADLEVMPQYQPVRYSTDESAFMLQNPSEAVKQEYRDIQNNYCSQPLPDYYTLTLRVHRKRTTALESVVCNATRKNCPPEYRDGETMTYRSFNTKCPKESPDYDTTLPVPVIADGGNSMLCTRRTALLTKLFKTASSTIARDEPLAFPSVDCRQSMFKCEQCFEEKMCIDRSAMARPCCAASCHAQQFCKASTGQVCRNVQAECATGDLLQYVLIPRFEPNSFQCHLKRVRPVRLMSLAYRVTVPRTRDSWNSTLKLIDVPLLDTYFGELRVDFFTIFYNTTLNASDEVLLRGAGRSRRSGTFSALNLTVTNFSPEAATERNTSIKVSNYASDTWLANVSSLPFDISTTNWQSKHGCDLDVDRVLRPATMPNASRATPVQIATRRVAAAVRGPAAGISSSGSELLYTFMSQQLPVVKLSIQGNQSLLASLFPRSAIDYSTVRVEATSGVGSTLWEVLITGRTKRCNSYVGVTVSDRTANAQLARYDLLVSCTGDDRELQEPQFWIRVNMAEPRQRAESSASPSPFGKLLQVSVADSFTSVSYYVSATSPAARASSAPSTLDMALAPVPASDDNRSERNLPRSAVIVGIASIVVALVMASAYGLFAACSWLRKARLSCLHPLPDAMGGSSSSSSSTSGVQKFKRPGDHCGRRAAIGLTIAYVLYRLIYSAAFSITALLLITRHFTMDSSSVLSELGSFRERTSKDAESEARRTADWRVHELQRQQEALDERIAACRVHVAAKRTELSDRVAAMARQARLSRGEYQSALQTMLRDVDNREVDRVKAFVKSALRNASLQADAVLSGYGQLLDDVHDGSWLHLAKVLLQQTSAADSDTLDDTSLAVLSKMAVGLEFLRSESTSLLAFLGIDRPQAVARTLDSMYKELAAFDTDLATTSGSQGPPDEVAFVPSSEAATYTKLLTPSGRIESVSEQGSQPLQQTPPKWLSGVGGVASTGAYAIVAVVDLLLFIRRMCSLASDVKSLRRRLHCRCSSSSVEGEGGGSSRLQPSGMGGNSSAWAVGDGPRLPIARSDSPTSVSATAIRSQQSQASNRNANSRLSEQTAPSRATVRSAGEASTTAGASRAAAGPASVTVASSPFSEQQQKQWSRADAAAAKPPPPQRPPPTLQPTSGLLSTAAAASALGRTPAHHAIIWLALVAVLVTMAVALDEHLLTRRLLLRASGLERLEGDSSAAVAAGNLYAKLHALRVSRSAESRLKSEFDPLLHHLLKHDSLHVQEMSWLFRLHDARKCSVLRASGKPCSPPRPSQLPPFRGRSIGSSTSAAGLLSASPCHTVPVTARQLTTDSLATLSQAVVVNDFQKYVNALRDVVLTTIGSIVLFVNVLAIVCVIEMAAMRYVKAKRFLHAAGATVRSHLGFCPSAEQGSCQTSDTASDVDGDEGNGDRDCDRGDTCDRVDSRSLRSEPASEQRSTRSAAQSARSAAQSARSDRTRALSDFSTHRAGVAGPSSSRSGVDDQPNTTAAAPAAAGYSDLPPAILEPEGLMSDSWCHDGMFSASLPSSSRAAVAAAAEAAGGNGQPGGSELPAPRSPLPLSAAAAAASLLCSQGVQVLQVGETEL